ncbi:MAG: 4Fe-4S binding protein [Thermoplasmata archaeon]|nr:4Fe-4S binding protein [Thermoplasmata archaeon]
MICSGNCASCPVPLLFLAGGKRAKSRIKKEYTKPIQKKRLASQFIFLFITNAAFIFGVTGLIYPYFYCWEAPQATMSCPIGIMEHAVLETSIALALILTGTIFIVSSIFGRAACGWACPIGFLQDLIGKDKKKNKKGMSERDRKARYIKYAILAAIPPVVYITGTMAYTNICPIGGLTATIPILLLSPGGYTPTAFFIPKITLVALTIFLIVFVRRGWCKYLCPVGAMMGPFNKVSLLQIKFDESKCLKCYNCAIACPMDINMPYDNKSAECIRCGLCIDACPTDALKFGFTWQ